MKKGDIMLTKMGRSTIAALLAFIMLFGCAGAVGAAELPADIVGTEYEQAVNVLTGLGIVNGYVNGTFQDGYIENAFEPDKAVTRAEFVKMVVAALGMSNVAQQTSDTGFSDVPADHYAAAEIRYAVGIGLIDGVSQTEFQPDSSILYEQAIKILVSALGYRVYAEDKGGYPTGYLFTAAERGISRNVQASAGEVVSRGMAALLIYQSLDVDYMQVTGVGEGAVYEVREGETILTNLHHLELRQGVVRGTHETLLTGESYLKEDQVLIDDTVYQIGNTDAASYLGYMVEFYTPTDLTSSEVPTLMYFKPLENKNTVYQLEADEIASDKTTESLVVCFPDQDRPDRDEKLKLSQFTDVIYNGAVLSGYKKEDLTPETGFVTLIDNDTDGVMDVVLIEAYDTYVATMVKNMYNRIYDSYSSRYIELDASSAEFEVSIEKDGEPITYQDINEMDIVMVADSKNETGKKLRRAVVMTQTIDGTVAEISGDEVVIGEKEYQISQSYLEASSRTGSGAEKLEIGDAGTFRLDINGEIASFLRDGSSVSNYGYLVAAGKRGALSDEADFKIFSYDGQLLMVTSAEKMTYNEKEWNADGERYNGRLVLEEPAFQKDGAFAPQLIKYALNEDGELKEIETAVSGYDENRFSLDEDYRGAAQRIDSTYVLSGKYYIPESVLIFNIGLSENGKVDEEQLQILKRSNISSNSTKYKPAVYDVDKYGAIKVMVMEERDAGDNFYWLDYSLRVLTLVESKQQVLDGEDVRYKLTGYFNGKPVSYIAQDDSVNELVEQVQPGDLVQISENNGRIARIRRVFALHGKLPETHPLYRRLDSVAMSGEQFGQAIIDGEQSNAESSGLYGIFGITNTYHEDIMKVMTLDAAGNRAELTKILRSGAYICYFDETNPRNTEAGVCTREDILSSTSEEALDGSVIFLYTRNGSPTGAVIYKLLDPPEIPGV